MEFLLLKSLLDDNHKINPLKIKKQTSMGNAINGNIT